uniref:C-type lectin domain-containing protein n=1 Tax=Oryzias sinensis TaxID=183150 RepID=A0A8C7WT29_9TELE
SSSAERPLSKCMFALIGWRVDLPAPTQPTLLVAGCLLSGRSVFSPHMMNEWKERLLAVLIGCFFPEIFTLSSCLRQYHFVNQSLSWTEAQIYCRQIYRDLATIEDPKELKQLINRASSAGVSSDFWIGLYNQIHWRWADGFTGKGADYRNWNTADSDPDFISANQFCVNMGDGGEWWDRSCGNNFTFICYRGENIIFL